MKKEITLVIVVMLFFGLAIAPSINANINFESLKNDLVNISLEYPGFYKNENQKITITVQEKIELENIINDFKTSLEEAESEKKTIEIYNDLIEKLDKFGLLGDLTIKQAQNLITGRYKKINEKISKIKLFKDIGEKNESNMNLFCLLSGRTNNTFCAHRLNPYICMASFFILFYGILITYRMSYNSILSSIILGLSLLPMLFWSYFSIFVDKNPVAFFNILTLGFYYELDSDDWYSSGWIDSLGLLGHKKWDGQFLGALPGRRIPHDPLLFIQKHPAVWGFNGFKIGFDEDNCDKFYFGTGLVLSVDYREDI